MLVSTPPAAWAVDPYAHTALEARAVRAGQRLAMATGAVSLSLGLALLLWPGRTPLVAAAILGAWLLAAGLLRLADAAAPGEASGPSRTLAAMAGLLYLIAAVTCLRNLLPSLELLAVAVGMAWFAGGVSEIISALTGGPGGWARRGAVSAGAAAALGGLALVFWPAISLDTLVWLAGAWLLGIGSVQVARALRARRPAGA
jgi:uncharacterized membrane protein HdeD (DUF308 family)